MKFIIKNTSGENPTSLLRRVGYYFQREENSELSFVRPLERNGYPRFHLYIKANENNELIFNLHLDQKRPVYPHTKRGQSALPRYGARVYKGASAHAGEYDGKTVESETERIKQILG